jgi:hypothetical protein
MAHADSAYASGSEFIWRLWQSIRRSPSASRIDAAALCRVVPTVAVILLLPLDASAEQVGTLTPSAIPVTTNTWLIFGFTDGADAGFKGERSIYYDSVVRFSRHEAGLAGLRNSMGVTYSTSDRATWWLGGATTALRGVSDQFDAQPRCCDASDSNRAGPLAGWKYRIVPRTGLGTGVSIQVEPYWERAIRRGNEVQQAFGSDVRLIIDKVLSPERLFGALNIAYQPEGGVSHGRTSWDSDIELSAAIAAKASDHLIVGIEARHLQSYSGYFFSEKRGHAFFAGPTFYLPLGDNGYFGAAWSTQVFGRAVGDAHGGLDLLNYERHQVRFKFGVTF